VTRADVTRADVTQSRGNMAVFDLNSAELVALPCQGEAVETDVSPHDLAKLGSAGTAVIAIRFERFSDGRGFTVARHLREAHRYEGAILAVGHLIPDQATYLRRCGVSHVEIEPGALAQWQRSLSLSAPPMQRLLSSQRARYPGAATS
jgi:uncharacterized protein (DUF934 family)